MNETADALIAEARSLMSAGRRFDARRLLVEKGRDNADRATILAFLEENFPFTPGWAGRLRKLTDQTLPLKDRAVALREGEPPTDPRFAQPLLDLIDALARAGEHGLIGVVVAQGERCLGRGDLESVRALTGQIPPRRVSPAVPPGFASSLSKTAIDRLAERIEKGEPPRGDLIEARLRSPLPPHVRSVSLLGSDVVAFAESESRVEVHFPPNGGVSVFDTVHEGGRLLLAPCTHGPMLIAGGYYRGGVGGYDTKGERAWYRRDFVLSGDLALLPPGPNGKLQLGVGCSAHDCARPKLHGPEHYQIVSACEGRQIAELERVRRLFADPAYPLVVAMGPRLENGTLLRADGWEEIAELEPGWLLDAAFSGDRFATAEGKHGLRCYDREGRRLWVWKPGDPCNVIRVARHQASGGWVAIETTGRTSVVLLTADGQEVQRATPDTPGALSTFDMSYDGDVIACADRTIRALPSLEVIRRLERPSALDPEPRE